MIFFPQNFLDYFLSINIFCTCKEKRIFNVALRQKQKSRITTFIAVLHFTVTMHNPLPVP